MTRTPLSVAAGSGWKLASLLGLFALFLVGCRSVWVHPEASAEKYAHDLHVCRYGTEPSVAAGASPGRAQRGWKQCMVGLGWETDTGFRSNQPWSKPQKPRKLGERRHKFEP